MLEDWVLQVKIGKYYGRSNKLIHKFIKKI